MKPGADIVFILIVGAVGWWISGYDTKVTGEDHREDFIRRAARTAIAMLLAAMATILTFIAVPIFVMIALVWMSCLAEFGARQIHKLIDPDDKREFDPKETERKLDRLAQLVREGRRTEVLYLCKELQESGQGSPMAIEATFHHLYQETLVSMETSPDLTEVRRLGECGEFTQVESLLKQIIAVHPTNWEALLLLMKVYARNLSQPHQALALLNPGDKQLQMPVQFIEYARRSIGQWADEAHQAESPETGFHQESGASVNFSPTAVMPEVSVEELLKTNQFATAVERLEKEISEQPKNFELRLKLAEVYAVNCADSNRASKIVHQMESASAFTQEEIQLAKAKLREWQKGRKQPGF
jgi:hypothetical protein